MNELEKKELKKIAHISFEALLFFKLLNALGEIIGGILLILFNPEKIQNIVHIISQKELKQDPNDIVMNILIKFSNNLSLNLDHFLIVYLLSQGIVKIIIVTLLYKKKLWAYPLSVIVLILFVIYQLYELTIASSFIIIFLTILDMILIFLTITEYKRIKVNNSTKL